MDFQKRFFQAAEVAGTLRAVRRWRHDPSLRPSRGRLWGRHILLPLVANLSLAAMPLWLRAKGWLPYMRLFSPDVAWTALLGGGLAGLWGVLRTGLMLRQENER